MGAVIVQYQAEKRKFKDLPSGQYYFDTSHNLCMKLDNGNGKEEMDKGKRVKGCANKTV